MSENLLVLASANKKKVAELQKILKSCNLGIIPQNSFFIEEAEETGLTFVENALIKARFASKKTNLAAISDDSGLIVPALNYEPGLYSSRYHLLQDQNHSSSVIDDKKNLNLVLAKLNALENAWEHPIEAYFVCVLVLLKSPDDPCPYISYGYLHGEIIKNPRGEKGFGYDPIFYLKNYKKTLAEISSAEKNAISHRSIAIKNLIKQLENKAW